MDESPSETMSGYRQHDPLFYEDPDPNSERVISPDREKPHNDNENAPGYTDENAYLAGHIRALEPKANDAALKRAILGREEAETEMRRYREEVRGLRKHIEEGRAREKKVGERLETVMENYGKAKETQVRTQALWEKEIKKSRKEVFKSQSVIVKFQGELQAARTMARITETNIAEERARTKKREEEAFAARYQLVGVQEELASMIEKVRLVEQERDALKMIAKNEEIARIAAEGQLPLPLSAHDDEFASPRKVVSRQTPFSSVTSSASAEEEIEQLKMELLWARRNAEKAHEQVEFLQMECQFKCCSFRLAESRADTDHIKTELKTESEIEVPRHRTVFNAAEGIFRTTSISPQPEESPWISPARPEPAKIVLKDSRTPSCEPPTSLLVHAATAQEANTSLLSLIDGSDRTSPEAVENTIVPTMSREEAIAKIRERRGRAHSLAQEMITPKKPTAYHGGRDFSAPAIRSAARNGGRI